MMFLGLQIPSSGLYWWRVIQPGEGLIDHQILGIHHVKPGPNELAWDFGFLVAVAVVVWVDTFTG